MNKNFEQNFQTSYLPLPTLSRSVIVFPLQQACRKSVLAGIIYIAGMMVMLRPEIMRTIRDNLMDSEITIEEKTRVRLLECGNDNGMSTGIANRDRPVV